MSKDWDNWEAPEPGNFVCSICLEPLSAEAGIECTDDILESYSDKSAVATLICGHVFHMYCLQQNYWTRGEYGERRSCPICKRKLITEPLSSPMIRLYLTTTDDHTKPPPCDRCKVLEAELEKLKLKRNQQRQPSLPKARTLGGGHAVLVLSGRRGRGHVIRGGLNGAGDRGWGNVIRGEARGRSRGRVNGEAGDRGHVNRGLARGRSRGHINGEAGNRSHLIRFEAGSRSPGRVNGETRDRGHVIRGETRSRSRGRVNGESRGRSRGRVNDEAGDRGHVIRDEAGDRGWGNVIRGEARGRSRGRVNGEAGDRGHLIRYEAGGRSRGRVNGEAGDRGHVIRDSGFGVSRQRVRSGSNEGYYASDDEDWLF